MNSPSVLAPQRESIFSRSLLWIVLSILLVFFGRTLLASRGPAPALSDLFTVLTFTGSLGIAIVGRCHLMAKDWLAAAAAGLVVAVSMVFTTLFSPFPFLGVVGNPVGQALVRGVSTSVAMLGGLAVMRQGGPVQISALNGEWGKLARSLLFGLGIGALLAILNVFALQFTQGQPAGWESPLAAALDALQPAVVEEVVYRFALLGLLWFALRDRLPRQAAWLAGLLTLLIHNFAHFDDLFLQAPLMVLGMGLVMAVVWGLPMTILALRRDLESAVVVHWLQDFARFWAGF